MTRPPASGFARFLSELKRRRVFRAAGVYAAVAFGVLQAADLAVGPLRLPGWTMTLLWVLALAGFPIALVLAWLFEVRPETAAPGALAAADGSDLPPAPGGDRRPSRLRIAMAAALVLAALSLGAWGVATLRPGTAAEDALDAGTAVVLPFRVTGADPALAYLREGMLDLLAAKLTGEGGPRAVDPRSVLAAWKRLGGSTAEDPDVTQALTLAHRLGAGLLLTGSVVGTPARLTLNAALLDARSGAQRLRADVTGPADSLSILVDQLAAQLLSLEAGEAQMRLSSLTSTSLPALRAYLDGQRAYRAGRFEEAMNLYDEALAHDSTFALAALGRLLVAGWTHAPDWVDIVERARALHDRLSPRDQAMIQASAGARWFPDAWSAPGEALVAAERVASLAPDSPEGWHLLGELLLHVGSTTDRPGAGEEALAMLGRAAALDSTFSPPLFHLFEAALIRGDTAEVRRVGRAFLAVDSTSDTALYLRWMLASALGDSATIRRLRSELPRFPRVSLEVILFGTLVPNGPLQDADRVIDILRTRPASRAERFTSLRHAHRNLLRRGRPAAAARLLDEMDRLADSEQEQAEVRTLRVEAALDRDGDAASARAGLAAMDRAAAAPLGPGATARQRRIQDLCLPALWRVRHGDASSLATTIARVAEVARTDPAGDNGFAAGLARTCEAALRAFAAVQARDPGARAAVERLDRLVGAGVHQFSPPMALARLWEAVGEPRRALAAVRRRYPFDFDPPSLREEARLAALAGEKDAALRAYQHYLRLRSDPEPSVRAEVERVRAELARLVGEGRP